MASLPSLLGRLLIKVKTALTGPVSPDTAPESKSVLFCLHAATTAYSITCLPSLPGELLLSPQEPTPITFVQCPPRSSFLHDLIAFYTQLSTSIAVPLPWAPVCPFTYLPACPPAPSSRGSDWAVFSEAPGQSTVPGTWGHEITVG